MKTIKDVFKHFKFAIFCKETFLAIKCTKASGSSGVLYFTRVSELVSQTRANLEGPFFPLKCSFFLFFIVFFLVILRLANIRRRSATYPFTRWESAAGSNGFRLAGKSRKAPKSKIPPTQKCPLQK